MKLFHRKRLVIVTQFCNDPHWFMKWADTGRMGPDYCDYPNAEWAKRVAKQMGYRVKVIPHNCVH